MAAGSRALCGAVLLLLHGGAAYSPGQPGLRLHRQRQLLSPRRAAPALGLLDALDDIAEFLDQMGGYDNSFSERQLKGEVDLEQPRGPREVNETTINVFLSGLLLFAVTLLLGVGTYIKVNHVHTIFP